MIMTVISALNHQFKVITTLRVLLYHLPIIQEDEEVEIAGSTTMENLPKKYFPIDVCLCTNATIHVFISLLDRSIGFLVQ